MPIQLMKGSIFESKMQCLVIPVNTEGTMGAGLANQFKVMFPECEQVYRRACSRNSYYATKQLALGGDIHWYQYSIERWFLFFATKMKWSKPSRMEWIERGLNSFVSQYSIMNIKSVAFPMLGCGLGNLDKVDVGNLYMKYLDSLDIPIEVWQQ